MLGGLSAWLRVAVEVNRAPPAALKNVRLESGSRSIGLPGAARALTYKLVGEAPDLDLPENYTKPNQANPTGKVLRGPIAGHRESREETPRLRGGLQKKIHLNSNAMQERLSNLVRSLHLVRGLGQSVKPCLAEQRCVPSRPS
jgi:hypothetical protein